MELLSLFAAVSSFLSFVCLLASFFCEISKLCLGVDNGSLESFWLHGRAIHLQEAPDFVLWGCGVGGTDALVAERAQEKEWQNKDCPFCLQSV